MQVLFRAEMYSKRINFLANVGRGGSGKDLGFETLSGLFTDLGDLRDAWFKQVQFEGLEGFLFRLDVGKCDPAITFWFAVWPILDEFDLERCKTDHGQVINDILVRRVRAQVADVDLSLRFWRRCRRRRRCQRRRCRRHVDVPDVSQLSPDVKWNQWKRLVYLHTSILTKMRFDLDKTEWTFKNVC